MRLALAALGALAVLAGAPAARAEIPPSQAPIDHLVVIYLENHTFDNLYGLFPGANGVLPPDDALPAGGLQGLPYPTLPDVEFAYPWPPRPDPRFPKNLPNRPFPINDYVPLTDIVEMPLHVFYPNILQIAGGRNDKFVAWSDSGALTMGYFDTTKL